MAERDFRLFFLGRTASAVGDWLLQIALPLYVYSRTGSTTETALTFMFATLPGVLLAPIAGALVDRWNRRRIMVMTDLGRAGLLVILLGEPNHHLIWLIFVVAAAQGSLSQLFAPAQSAVLPALVPSSELTAANSTIAAGSELALLGGPVLGGVVYTVAGLRLAAALDMASYVISAASVVSIGSSAFRRRDASEAKPRPPSVWSDLIGGMRFTVKHRALSSLLVVSMMSFLGGGLLRVLIVPFARGHLHASGTEYGAILSAQAAGGLVGAVAVRRSTLSTASARLVMSGSLLLVAAAVEAFAFTANWWSAGACLALGGIPTSISGILTMTLLQTLPPDSRRGRVFGLYQAASALGLVLGAPIAGALASGIGALASIELAALVFAASGAVALVSLPSTTP